MSATKGVIRPRRVERQPAADDHRRAARQALQGRESETLVLRHIHRGCSAPVQRREGSFFDPPELERACLQTELANPRVEPVWRPHPVRARDDELEIETIGPQRGDGLQHLTRLPPLEHCPQPQKVGRTHSQSLELFAFVGSRLRIESRTIHTQGDDRHALLGDPVPAGHQVGHVRGIGHDPISYPGRPPRQKTTTPALPQRELAW